MTSLVILEQVRQSWSAVLFAVRMQPEGIRGRLTIASEENAVNGRMFCLVPVDQALMWSLCHVKMFHARTDIEIFLAA